MAVPVISRRSVLDGAALAAVAGVAGFVAARHSSVAHTKSETTGANAYGAAPAAGSSTPLATLSEVPTGGGLILATVKIVLTRVADDTIHGFSAVCTHQGCSVSSVENGTIACPCHGSRFDARTGAVVNGPATNPLPPIAVVVRNGGIYRQ
jgi:Rieske Fe-S protein